MLIAMPRRPSACSSLLRIEPRRAAVAPVLELFKKWTINLTSLPASIRFGTLKYKPVELMLSITQLTLKGRSPESTPQTLAGNGSLQTGLPTPLKVDWPRVNGFIVNSH